MDSNRHWNRCVGLQPYPEHVPTHVGCNSTGRRQQAKAPRENQGDDLAELQLVREERTETCAAAIELSGLVPAAQAHPNPWGNVGCDLTE